MAITGPLRRLPGILLAIVLSVSATGIASPASEESKVAIPPDRESAAKDLLAPLTGERDDGLELRGPSIERDHIKWWLMRGDETRGLLLLIPRTVGQPDDPRSKSFAIQIAWAPDVEPAAAELALLEAAIDTVQARDEGGFFVLLVDTMLEPEEPITGSPDRAVDADPDRVRLWWALKLATVTLLVGFAMAVTLRPRRASPRDRMG